MKRAAIAIAIVALMCAVPFCGMDINADAEDDFQTDDSSGETIPELGILEEIGKVFEIIGSGLYGLAPYEYDADDGTYDVWDEGVSVTEPLILEKSVIVEDGVTITFSNGGDIVVPAGMSFVINGSVDLVCDGSDVSFQLSSDPEGTAGALFKPAGKFFIGNAQVPSDPRGDTEIGSTASVGITFDARSGYTEENPVLDYEFALDILSEDKGDHVIISPAQNDGTVLDYTCLANNPEGKELGLVVKADLTPIVEFISGLAGQELTDIIPEVLEAFTDGSLVGEDTELSLDIYDLESVSGNTGSKLINHSEGESKSLRIVKFSFSLKQAVMSLSADTILVDSQSCVSDDGYPEVYDYTDFEIRGLKMEVGSGISLEIRSIEYCDRGGSIRDSGNMIACEEHIDSAIYLKGIVLEFPYEDADPGSSVAAYASVDKVTLRSEQYSGCGELVDDDGYGDRNERIRATLKDLGMTLDSQHYRGLEGLELTFTVDADGDMSADISVVSLGSMKTQDAEDYQTEASGLILSIEMSSASVKGISDLVAAVISGGDLSGAVTEIGSAFADGGIALGIEVEESYSVRPGEDSYSVRTAISELDLSIGGADGMALEVGSFSVGNDLGVENLSVTAKVDVTCIGKLVEAIMAADDEADITDILSGIDLSGSVEVRITMEHFHYGICDIGGLELQLGGDDAVSGTSAVLALDTIYCYWGPTFVVEKLRISFEADYEPLIGFVAAVIAGGSDDDADGFPFDLLAGFNAKVDVEMGYLCYADYPTYVELGEEMADTPSFAATLTIDIQKAEDARMNIVLGLDAHISGDEGLNVLYGDGDNRVSIDALGVGIGATFTFADVDLVEMIAEEDIQLYLSDHLSLVADLEADEFSMVYCDSDSDNIQRIIASDVVLKLDSGETLSVGGTMSGLEVYVGEVAETMSVPPGVNFAEDEDHIYLAFGDLTFAYDAEENKLSIDCGFIVCVDILDGEKHVSSEIDGEADNIGCRMALNREDGFIYEVVGKESEIDGVIVFTVKPCKIDADSDILSGMTYPAGTTIAVEATGELDDGEAFIGWNVSGTEYFEDEFVVLPAGDITIGSIVTRLAVVEEGDTSVSSETDDIAVSSEDLGVMKDNAGDGSVDIVFASGTISFSNGAIGKIIPESGNVTIRMAVGGNAPDMGNVGEADREMLSGAVFVSVNMLNVATTKDLGRVSVTVPYVLSAGMSADSVTVYYVSSDGNVTAMETAYADGYVTFVTDHFSDYAIVAQAGTPSDVPDDDDNVLVIAVAVLAVLAVLGLAVLGLAVLMYRRKAA